MDLGLAERTALVCASTSGLGLAAARALCEDGARVVVTSRSSERAEEVAAALPNAIGIGCDLLAADGAARLFGESTKRVGKIDILVRNGPGPAPGTAADVDDAGVDSAGERRRDGQVVGGAGQPPAPPSRPGHGCGTGGAAQRS
jgi:3-oxoacyl-[acyl-carrier protein] reductase